MTDSPTMRVSSSAMWPAGLDRHLAGETVLRERGEQPAELLGERQERLDRVRHGAALHVHGGGHELALQREVDGLGDLHAGAVLGLLGRRPEVGGDDGVRQPEQRRVGLRLGVEHVDGGTGDDPVTQGIREVGLDDDATAGDVEQPRGRLHLGQPVAVEEPERLRRLRQVDGDEVGLGEDLVDGVHESDTEPRGPVGSDERVVGHQPHAEGVGALGHERADAPEPQHPEGLVVQLGAVPAAALPPALDERRVRLWDVAGQAQQQGQGVLGRGHDVRLRRVADHDARPGRGLDVDVVEPHTCTTDDLEVGRGSDDVGVDGRLRADDDGVEARHTGEQLVLAESGVDDDLVVDGQRVDAGLGELVRDEDAHGGPSGWGGAAHRSASGRTGRLEGCGEGTPAPRPRGTVPRRPVDRGQRQRDRRGVRRPGLGLGRRLELEPRPPAPVLHRPLSACGPWDTAPWPPPRWPGETVMASKDKGGKSSKTAASHTPKEKRQAKLAKKQAKGKAARDL
jgi:hypothetical protein